MRAAESFHLPSNSPIRWRPLCGRDGGRARGRGDVVRRGRAVAVVSARRRPAPARPPPMRGVTATPPGRQEDEPVVLADVADRPGARPGRRRRAPARCTAACPRTVRFCPGRRRLPGSVPPAADRLARAAGVPSPDGRRVADRSGPHRRPARRRSRPAAPPSAAARPARPGLLWCGCAARWLVSLRAGLWWIVVSFRHGAVPGAVAVPVLVVFQVFS